MQNLEELYELVIENRTSLAAMAEILITAKKELSRKDYKAFIESTELSKDQVSRLLKRGSLLADGFSKEAVGAYPDSIVLKLTNRVISQVEELTLAKVELAKGAIDLEDFKMMYESYKVVKTDGEKFATKIKGVVKALDTLELNDTHLTEGANALKEFVEEWADK